MSLNNPMNELKEKAGVLKDQHGGSHYKSRGIEPVEYWWANWGAAPFLAEINKLTTRFEDKGGAVDLQKSIHYTQMLLEFKYGIKSNIQYQEPEKVPPEPEINREAFLRT